MLLTGSLIKDMIPLELVQNAQHAIVK